MQNEPRWKQSWIGPLFILQELGTPEEVLAAKQHAEELLVFWDRRKDSWGYPGWPSERTEAIRDYLQVEVIPLFDGLLSEVKQAEAALAEKKMKFDRKVGEVARVPGERGGRPRLVFNETVGWAWEHLQPIYRRETGDSRHNCQELRNRILEWIDNTARRFVFPREKLDASSDGPIDVALNNYLQHRRR